VYEEKLTGRPHDTSAKKATIAVTMKMWMQFNVMPWTSLDVDAVRRMAERSDDTVQ